MGSLHSSLVIYFGLVAVIPLLFVGGILFFDAYVNLEDEITNNFQHDSEISGHTVRLLYHLRTEQITTFSQNPLFMDVIQNSENIDYQKLSELVTKFEESTSGDLDEVYTEIVGFYRHSIITSQNEIIFSTDESLIGTKKDVTHLFPVSYVVNENSNNREMLITVPIFDSSNNLLGYFQSVMGVVTTNHILLDSRTFQTDENYLVNLDKIMISESRFWDSSQTEILVDTKSVQICLEDGENYVGFYEDYRGVPIFGSSYCAKDLGFILLREMDAEELFSPLNELVLTLILSVIGFGSLSVFFGFLISKRITSPLLELKKSVEEISDGNYDIKVNLEGKNEIFDLARSFDTLLHSLKVSQFEVDSQKDIILENNRELKKIDVQKGEFAAMASHELKTPLVPIRGYLEMLLEDDLVGPLNGKQKEILKKSLDNVEILQKLILQLLTVHRLEINQVKWSISNFDILDLMQNVYADFEHLMNKKNITFTNIFVDSVIISSDYEQIREIFSNMLQNALDFTPDGGAVEIDAKISDDLVVFSVKDNGIGIAKEKQKGLFKKFYQVDTSVTRSHGGTGLGLSICRGLAEGLGGKIWVESDEGKGSIFFFSILNHFNETSEND